MMSATRSPRAHAHPGQHRRAPLHLGQEGRVAHPLAEPRDRRPVGEPTGRGLEHREHRFLGVGLEAVGTSGRIRREPRSVFGHARHHRAVAIAAQTEEARGQGLFLRGARLVATYIRMHPRPFLASVGRVAAVRAVLARADHHPRPGDRRGPPAGLRRRPGRLQGVAGRRPAGRVRTGRALGIMVRRYYSGVAGERVMATLRNRVADRYRDLQLQYHRETPTGELLAHMEADVKAAVDVFWPVPVRHGRDRAHGARDGHALPRPIRGSPSSASSCSPRSRCSTRLRSAHGGSGADGRRRTSARCRPWRTSRSTARSS